MNFIGKKLFTWITFTFFLYVNTTHIFCHVIFTWRWIHMIFTIKMWISQIAILPVYTYRYTDIEWNRVHIKLNVTVVFFFCCSCLRQVEWLLTFRTSVRPCSTSGVCPPTTKLWRSRTWNQVFQLPEIVKLVGERNFNFSFRGFFNESIE